jgi:cytochrome c peroxidase
MLRQLSTLLLAGWVLFSCSQPEDNVSTLADKKVISLPSHFPEVRYPSVVSSLTEEKIKLGKMLFFDPILSADSTVSCGSCHHQSVAFSDAPMVKSLGVGQTPGFRNTTAIQNLLWKKEFMADGGVFHLNLIAIAPVTDPLEMNANWSDVLARLNNHPNYTSAFARAYQTTKIEDQHLLQAVAAFMATMISADSKYDAVVQGKAAFTSVEQRGFEVFSTYCAGCHKPPLFSDFSFRNNGQPLNPSDPGRYRVTSVQTDKAKFQVPSLRNVALTPPYMHSGHLATLDQVLDHYAGGNADTTYMDPMLKANPFRPSASDQEALKKFLLTLTDPVYIQNEAFRKP